MAGAPGLASRPNSAAAKRVSRRAMLAMWRTKSKGLAAGVGGWTAGSGHRRPIGRLWPPSIRTTWPFGLLGRPGGQSLVDLRLDGCQVEAGTLLHRREVDRGLGELGHFLLHEHEAPELVGKPVVVGE